MRGHRPGTVTDNLNSKFGSVAEQNLWARPEKHTMRTSWVAFYNVLPIEHLFYLNRTSLFSSYFTIFRVKCINKWFLECAEFLKNRDNSKKFPLGALSVIEIHPTARKLFPECVTVVWPSPEYNFRLIAVIWTVCYKNFFLAARSCRAETSRISVTSPQCYRNSSNCSKAISGARKSKTLPPSHRTECR